MKIKLPILFNVNRLSSALTEWNASCNELVKRYANKDDKGNPVVINDNYDIPDNVIDDYNKEFNDIMRCDANISEKSLQKIPIQYFDEYDESKFDILTLNDIQLLQFMIDM